MSVEREIKFDVEAHYVVPPLDALVAGVRPIARGTRLMRAVYWDTPDLGLLAAGIGLRHRSLDDGGAAWTIKGSSAMHGAAVVRDEVTLEGEISQLPPSLLRRLPHGVRLHDLEPVATLRTRRDIVDLVDGGGRRIAELVDDSVEVLDEAGDVVHRFRELEVESLDEESEHRLQPVLDALARAGARPATVMAKYVRALQALGRLPAA